MTKASGMRRAGSAASQQRANLCLDFANTLHCHASAEAQETLHAYADLLDWAVRHRAASAAEAQELARRAASGARGAEARAVLGRAIALREAIYRIFVARIGRAMPAAPDVQRLNDELQRALPHYGIAFGAQGGVWALGERAGADEPALDQPLWPIAQSAVELLLSGPLADRVGQCADPGGCGWLFLDLSRNRSRRWCSIADCGNRAKQRRLQERLRGVR